MCSLHRPILGYFLLSHRNKAGTPCYLLVRERWAKHALRTMVSSVESRLSRVTAVSCIQCQRYTHYPTVWIDITRLCIRGLDGRFIHRNDGGASIPDPPWARAENEPDLLLARQRGPSLLCKFAFIPSAISKWQNHKCAGCSSCRCKDCLMRHGFRSFRV